MADVTKPHGALISFKIEVFDLLSTGEFSGQPVNLKDRPEYKLKNGFIKIEGYDLNDCLLKVKERIEKLNGR